MKKSTSRAKSLVVLAFAAATAQAAVSVLDLGTAAPGSSYGGHPMAAYGLDPNPEGTMVTSVGSPAGYSALGFSAPAEVATVGSFWATWSHGYAGSVYYAAGTGLDLSLPTGVLAFYLYVQPNLFGVFDLTVTASAASLSYASRTVPIDGFGGAYGFAFWTDSSADPLTSISIEEPTGLADGFAAGEFGLGPLTVIPEPAAAPALLAGAALGLGLWLRRRAC
jgi:hypothetical protein